MHPVGAMKGKSDAPLPRRNRAWLFLVGTVAVYAFLFCLFPERIRSAAVESGQIGLRMIFPLAAAWTMMVVLNLFVTPAHASRFLGRRAGIRGVFLSALAGIVSMGPIYAWYPFLRTVRDKGAADFHLANFLSHRAVKPVLLPVMIGYFGWCYSMVFTAMSIAGALLVACIVGRFNRSPKKRPRD